MIKYCSYKTSTVKVTLPAILSHYIPPQYRTVHHSRLLLHVQHALPHSILHTLLWTVYELWSRLASKTNFIPNIKISFIFHRFSDNLKWMLQKYLTSYVTTYKGPSMVNLLTERYQEKYWTLKWKECSSSLMCKYRRFAETRFWVIYKLPINSCHKVRWLQQ
jgi:hypothetical protein